LRPKIRQVCPKKWLFEAGAQISKNFWKSGNS
jgi:hypothetical protein